MEGEEESCGEPHGPPPRCVVSGLGRQVCTAGASVLLLTASCVGLGWGKEIHCSAGPGNSGRGPPVACSHPPSPAILALARAKSSQGHPSPNLAQLKAYTAPPACTCSAMPGMSCHSPREQNQTHLQPHTMQWGKRVSIKGRIRPLGALVNCRQWDQAPNTNPAIVPGTCCFCL